MNPHCPRCGAGCSVRHGRFYREDDAQTIQRYRCRDCGKTHSSATESPTYRQKRRRLNRLIEVDIASSTAQRRIARKHRCSRKTVARKIRFLATQARIKSADWLSAVQPIERVQWDELITFEHSRLKPLSIAVIVAVGHRCILGMGVASIPASGPIAEISRKKYGKRPDRSSAMRKRVLKSARPYLSPTVQFESDEHARYSAEIRQVCAGSSHIQYSSIRGSLVGMGELKRTGYDPLFPINHTLSMLRDNIKRLARQTWCTTKRADVLEDILAIYMQYHNSELIQLSAKNQS